MTTGWASFYQQYHPLAEFVRQLETELANINPHIKDMLTITRTVERLKVCVCVCVCVHVYRMCTYNVYVSMLSSMLLFFHLFLSHSLPLFLPLFLPLSLPISFSLPLTLSLFLPVSPSPPPPPPPLQFTQKELVARSGSLGVVKQYNVKLQEVLCRHITELPVVGDDIEATSKKWKTLTMLVEEK